MKITGPIALMLLACFGSAFAQNDPARVVQKLERAWLDAYEQHDEKAMNEIVADDFVITFPDGSMQTKPEVMAQIRMPRRADSPTSKFHTEDVRARVYGDTVVLTGRVISEWRRGDETVSQNRMRYTDTYVKRNGRWQVVASHLSNAILGQKPEQSPDFTSNTKRQH